MPFKLRTFVCQACGAQVKRRAKADAAIRCTPCNIEAAATAARQMYDQAGPYWERWASSRGPAGRPRKDPDGPESPPDLGRRPFSPTG